MAKPSSARHTYRIDPVWDDLPEHTNTLVGISRDEPRLRFCREKNSHRGLREFERLKELIIFCPNQEAIAEIEHLQSLEFLYIDVTRAKDLSPLANCRSLRHLTIKGATQAGGLEWIRDLPPLDSLLIENFKKITDISPIASITGARAIGIEGSMWTRQKVDSFSPLSAIEGLEALFITNCKPAKDGLSPLHNLHNLRFLEAPGFYSEDEFLALENALPQLECYWFEQIRKHGTIKAAIDASIKT
jgi:hypothetical protein